MNIHLNSRQQGRRAVRGFSLVELLLTMVLVLCLAAASVFTFTAIYQSSNLDEGLDRFQSLIRFAQAEASTTGRKVRIQFVTMDRFSSDSESDLRSIKVTWEADLLNAPGVFETYTNKAWSEQVVNELVGVQKVKALGNSGEAPMSYASSAPPETADESELEEEFPSITFYPDGSCDSAEIVLASRNPDDARRAALRLSGLLGSVSTRTLPPQSHETLDDTGESAYEEYEEYNELFESSQPVQSEFARADFSR